MSVSEELKQARSTNAPTVQLSFIVMNHAFVTTLQWGTDTEEARWKSSS